MGNQRSRRTIGSVSLTSAFVTILLLAPIGVLAASFVVTSIPGEGWIQSPDNTAGDSAAIVAGPAGGLGIGSVELTSDATTDFVGISRPLVGQLDDLTGGSWMTFVTGDTGSPVSEAASLRFAGYQLAGLNGFTTVSIELSNNGGASPDVWETTAFDDESVVWQTNTTGSFCLQVSPCTLAAFKAQYPQAHLIGLTVAIGTGVPAVTSYFDGVELTFDGVTDDWDFEVAAEPSEPPSEPPSAPPSAAGSEAPIAGGPTTPPTSTLDPNEQSPLSGLLAVIGVVSLLGLLALVPARRSRLARPIRERLDPPPR